MTPAGGLPIGRDAFRRLFRAAVAGAAAVGFFLQAGAALAGKPSSEAVASLLRLLSYFTIQNTLAVAVLCAVRAAAPGIRAGPGPGTEAGTRSARCSLGPAVSLALLVSSIVTGAVYHAVLAPLWNPQGIAAAADVLMHGAVPVLVLLDWLLLEPHGRLRARNVPAVLVLPLLFLAVSLPLGSVTGRYPYFFLDPASLGILGFLRNAALFAIGFLGLGALALAADRALGRTSTARVVD